MFDKLAILKNKGYFPDAILDIGSFHGHWTNSMLSIYSDCKYFLFEAINYGQLSRYNDNTNIKTFNVILNNKIDDIDWYEMQNTGDSMFREKTHFFENCNIIKRQTIDLNTHIRNTGILQDAKNILIKIDCQGAEIPILQGASDILDRTDFIILEMPLFGQYNEGVPNFLEHIQYMDSIGFISYDIIDMHYINGFNMQIDMLAKYNCCVRCNYQLSIENICYIKLKTI